MSEETTIAESGGQWIQCQPEETYDYASAFPNASATFVKPEVMPETGILITESGIVTSYGMTANKESKLVMGLTWVGEHTCRKPNQVRSYNILKKHLMAFKTKTLSGSCLNLCAIWGDANVAHFFLDGMGKMQIVEDLGISLDSFDYIFVNDQYYQSQRQFVEKLKQYTKAKIIKPDRIYNYRFDSVTTPSMNGKPYHYRKGAFNKIRDIMGVSDITSNPKRFYISRESCGRDMTNKTQVESFLAFNSFDKVNMRDTPVSVLNNASIILGAHGAGLTNCIFAPRSASLIELVPEFYQYAYYMSVAHSLGMNYTNIVCKKAAANKPESEYDYTRRQASFDVDITALGNAIRSITN